MRRAVLALVVAAAALLPSHVAAAALVPPHVAAAALVPPHPATAVAAPGSTVVSLTFDDGFRSQAAAQTILSRHGLHATFYLDSELLNTENRLTFDDVRRIVASGSEIAGHTSDHVDLVTVDAAERRRQICNDRVALAQISGTTPRSFAYPYGATDAATEQLAAGCGYTSARIVGGLRSDDCRTCADAESIPARDPYAVRSSFSFVPATRVAAAEAAVRRAEAAGGGWVSFVFHDVCDGCSALAVAPDDLDALAGWLVAEAGRGVAVETVGDVVGGPARPLVHAPVPAGPYGVLVNGDLSHAGYQPAGGTAAGREGDGADSDEATRCWRRGGYGDNSAVWTRGAFGRGGSVAERVDVSGYRSGDRKLIVRLDSGSCSPRVRVGDRYRATVWYRSTAPIRLTAFSRGSPARWRFWTKSAPAPASPTWRQVSFDLPPVPPGVASISVGAALAANGSMVVDDFALGAPGTPVPASGTAGAGGGLQRSRAAVGALVLLLLAVPVAIAMALDGVRRRTAARRTA